MKIKYDELYNCSLEILKACGESAENAAIAAANLLKADARKITTHGTYLLTPIYKRAKAGQLTLPTRVTPVVDKAAVTVLDGGDGLGAVAGAAAMDIAIKKARQYGIASSFIKNTNNVGSLACYTELAAKEGMMAIMTCNAAPAMAPWGGAEAFLGTNPLALAIYTGGETVFSADMATSVVARGKIRKAARNGESIPDNWATDGEGNFTTDPNAALKGALLPMGGPKGSAIALWVDIMSGMLAGASFAPNLKSFHEPEGPTGVGASMIVLDISQIMDLGEFRGLMTEYINSITNMKKAKGFDKIFLPGEIEQANEKDSLENGIELDAGAVAELNRLLRETSSGGELVG